MQIQLVRGEREVPTKQTHDKQIVLILFFIKNGPILAGLFFLFIFVPVSLQLQSYKLKRHRWCARDSLGTDKTTELWRPPRLC